MWKKNAYHSCFGTHFINDSFIFIQNREKIIDYKSRSWKWYHYPILHLLRRNAVQIFLASSSIAFRREQNEIAIEFELRCKNHQGPALDISNTRGWFSHYNDVMMSAITSQINSFTIIYSTVYSSTDQRKHQSPASLTFVRGIHQWRGKVFRLMTSSCNHFASLSLCTDQLPVRLLPYGGS